MSGSTANRSTMPSTWSARPMPTGPSSTPSAPTRRWPGTGRHRSTAGWRTRPSPTFPSPKSCQLLDAGHVDAAVALMRVGESVVVQGQGSDQVVGPPHPEGLVVIPEDAPRDRHIRGVLAHIDLPVPQPHELTVIDPHPIRGIDPDPIVVVVKIGRAHV